MIRLNPEKTSISIDFNANVEEKYRMVIADERTTGVYETFL